MKKSLLSLSFGTFALGVAEFGMMGILNEIAADIDISVVQAGNLISAYAAGVAVGAPCLIFLRRMELRRLMLLLAAVIAIGNSMVAFSPSYTFLLIARFPDCPMGRISALELSRAPVWLTVGKGHRP